MRKTIIAAIIAAAAALTYALFLGRQHPEPYAHSPVNTFFLLLHVAGGSIGFLAAPLLVLKSSAGRKLYHVHAPLGKLYVGAIGAACVGGLYVNQFVVKGGAVSQFAFGVQFLVWGAATLVAFNKIRERKVISHSLWMVRSIAVTASFITHAWWVSLFTCLFPAATHGPHLAHNLGDWVTWIANLLIAEAIIRAIRAKYKDRYARELAVSGAQ